MSLICIDQSKCTKDGICAAVCPITILEQTTKEDYPGTNPQKEDSCIDCGHCVAACRQGALSHQRMSPDNLTVVDQDRIPPSGDILHWMQTRRSTRAYRDRELDPDYIRQVLLAASHAPTGHNAQDVEWIVINGRDRVRQMNQLVTEWMRGARDTMPQLYNVLKFESMLDSWSNGHDRITWNAPCVILNHADAREFTFQSSGFISMAHLDLAAHALGLGACWAGIFAAAARMHPALIERLNLPEHHQIIYAIMLGHPRYHYYRIPARKEPRIKWL